MVDERPRPGTLGGTTVAGVDAAARAAPPGGMSPCDVEALKRCLIEHDGDQKRCQAEVEAFKRACGVAHP